MRKTSTRTASGPLVRLFLTLLLLAAVAVAFLKGLPFLDRHYNDLFRSVFIIVLGIGFVALRRPIAAGWESWASIPGGGAGPDGRTDGFLPRLVHWLPLCAGVLFILMGVLMLTLTYLIGLIGSAQVR
ncbi:MAG TPA: hypothetical protein VJZ91_09000 [Blastocatellia bacterium]|nr:hypothetical protein [Blastocatellia bacterium]